LEADVTTENSNYLGWFDHERTTKGGVEVYVHENNGRKESHYFTKAETGGKRRDRVKLTIGWEED